MTSRISSISKDRSSEELSSETATYGQISAPSYISSVSMATNALFMGTVSVERLPDVIDNKVLSDLGFPIDPVEIIVRPSVHGLDEADLDLVYNELQKIRLEVKTASTGNLKAVAENYKRAGKRPGLIIIFARRELQRSQPLNPEDTRCVLIYLPVEFHSLKVTQIEQILINTLQRKAKEEGFSMFIPINVSNSLAIVGILKSDETSKKVDETAKKVDETAKKVDETAKKVDENTENINTILSEIRALKSYLKEKK